MERNVTIRKERRLLQGLSRNLKLLKQDSRLVSNNECEFLYVVDFAAIYEYIYRTYDPDAVSPLPGEPEERTFARQHAALDRVFQTPGRSLLLIPPYDTELRNHLHAVALSEQEWRNRAKWNDLRVKMRRLVEDSEEVKKYWELRREGRTGDDEERKHVLEIAKKTFPDLWTLLTWSQSQGLEGVSDLLARKVLRHPDRELLEQVQGYARPSLVDPWFDSILKFRKTDRAYQTHIDAMACSFVDCANKALNVARKVVLFITPSEHVREATINTPLLARVGDLEFNAVRDLDYMFASPVFAEPSTNDRNKVIESAESCVTDVLSASGRGGKAAAAAGQAVQRGWEAIQNLYFMLDRATGVDFSKFRHLGKNDGAFLEILKVLHQTVSDSSDVVHTEVEALVDGLRRRRDSIVNLIQASPAGLHRVSLSTDLAVFEVRGLPAEMPLSICLRGEGIRGLAEGLAKAYVDSDSKEWARIYDSIRLLASGASPDPEALLLHGYFLAVEGRWESAREVLRRVLQSNNPGVNAEGAYLLGMIHRKLFEAKPALEYLEQAAAQSPDDPRLQLEYGNALWLGWACQPSDQRSKDLFDRALRHVKIAYQILGRATGCRSLEIQVANLLAFLYTERAAFYGTDLQPAGVYLEKLEKLLPSPSDWIGRFHDTAAYFRHIQATRTNNLSERRRLLDEAVRLYGLALKDPQLVLPKRKLIGAHRAQALALAAASNEPEPQAPSASLRPRTNV